MSLLKKGEKKMNEQLNLITEWDKTFPKSNKVNHKKVTFHNRFGITLVVDMYIPKEIKGKLPGIAVCGPFGAVKEQASGLYAEKMAERGFLTIAFDPSFTGESTGVPRYVASVDINTEDYQAAVDFLSLCEEVDPEKIGIIGICGWGGIALNTASIDTRIKATVCSTMYDMSRVNHNGYFDSMQEDERYELKKSLNAQRIEDYKNKEYKTNRGYHKRSLNSNTGWNITSALSFINTPQNTFSNEIRNAVLIIHGEKAHSCYFSKDAYKNMVKNNKYKSNKELLIIPNAVHTDLYDNINVIPFDKIENFFKESFK